MLDWIDFGAAGTGWCRVDKRPLLILVGLTGVGKTTTVNAIKTAEMDFVLLPNRRAITDAVLIPAMQRVNGEPATPVQDRSRRFAYTRQYRKHFSGGMAHALSQMVVKKEMLSETAVLLFDGLRGVNEVTFAAQNLLQACFLFLDAPDAVRLQRLRKRNDAFDQVGAKGAGVETAVAIINGERQNYDPQATLTALQKCAPQRLIYVDTTNHTPDAIAQQVQLETQWEKKFRPQIHTDSHRLCSKFEKTRVDRPINIENITTTVFRLPLRGQLRWGKHSVLDELRHVLVQVTLSDGAQGVAEAPPRPTIYGETVYSVCSIIEYELQPRLLGQSAHDLSPMAQIKNNHTAKGALDMAVQDALAQSAGVSLAEYLGCTGTAIPVSYILGISDDDTMLAEAQYVFDQGVRVLKVKVGRDWPADVRRLRALQTQFGDAMQLYADANECFIVENAAARLAQLREMGVLYCEEPLPVEQIQARSGLQSGRHLPIIADDSAFTVCALQRELALDTFDILNIKTARTGYTASKQMLTLAWQAGKGVMVGSQASSSLGTACAGLFAALPGINCPSELSFFLKLKEEIVVNPPPIHEGVIQVADLLNVQIDPDLLKAATAVT